ncbi:FK506-binding protein 15 [Xenopus tropicalis]|uniref:peptidylprolyl isomerase n=1 Tax=Xenopus tropicalis TaxID=8364 RepID=A0A8J1IMT5_XENTR|nr:FK506-binding protein 15 [Xenopus tropicalis]
MFGDEEDTDFISPTGGAKLASLFGMDQSTSGQGNESFQYTAPKQPKKGPGATGGKPNKPSGPAGSGTAPAVLFATAVHAYRYINGQYVKQGKFGFAVLGNHTAKEYRILLYVSQQQPVTAAKIHPGFVFTVQPNHYAAFYDDQRQSWSVMFESEAAAVDFSKQVGVAKCNSSPALDTVIYQDLLPGEGQAADLGDLLEVAYTGWLFQNHELGQVFDSNVQKDKLLRLKLGSGKVIKGWEEGMLGIKKGGKRLVVIPPALGYGSQGVAGRIPPNATLAFEVDIKRMKVRDQGSDRQSVGSRDSPVSLPDCQPAEMLPQPPSSVPPKPGEPAIRAKSNSISEQLANPDVAKAKLISRMAKMGQPMLPFISGTPQPDSSDSEIEDPNTQRAVPSPVAPLPVRPTPQMNHVPAAQVPPAVPQTVPTLQGTSAALMPVGPIQPQALAPGISPGFQPYVQYPYAQSASTQLQSVAPVYPPQIQTPSHFQAGGDVTSFLMTEARQHSTEIRMSIGKIADKIDTLASKVDNLQKENSASSSHLLPGITSITMESAMIMNNIQRIIQENERLKHEVLEKSSRIEEQNGKISELINRNQKEVQRCMGKGQGFQQEVQRCMGKGQGFQQEVQRCMGKGQGFQQEVQRCMGKGKGFQQEVQRCMERGKGSSECEMHGKGEGSSRKCRDAWERDKGSSRKCRDAWERGKGSSRKCRDAWERGKGSSRKCRDAWERGKGSSRKCRYAWKGARVPAGKCRDAWEGKGSSRKCRDAWERGKGSSRKCRDAWERGKGRNMSLLPLSEVQETSEHSKTRAKSEKETRRQLEVRLSALEDEVSDLKAEKENLEKSLAERKRRSQQERQRAEEEQEELRRSLQEEVEELRQVLRKTREQAAAEQVSSRSRNGQRQSELEEQAAQLQPLRDQCAMLERRMAAMLEEQKKSKEKESCSAPEQALALRLNEQKVAELQEQAAQLQPLREKYERLRGQMSALLEEQTKWQSQEAPGTDTTEEVKKIMNRVFQGLRGEFELEEMYSGREVLGTIMSTIKATTLQLLKQNQPEAAPQSSGEEEEEEDEDEAQVVSPAPRAAVVPPDQEGNSDPKEDWASGAASEEASAALGEHGEAEEERSEGRDFTIEQVGEDGSDPVQVIQENLEETSALVHMMSSDMESSTVTPAPGAGKEPEHLRGEPLVSDPGATPTDPGATPTDPGATPTDPGATPTDLGATPIEPRATPIEPRATPIEPRATPIEPRATPTDPRATPTEAHPVAHDLRSHSRSPVAPQTQDSETPSSAADGGNLEDGKLEGPPPLGSDEETGSPVPPPLAQRPSAKPDRAQTQMERPLAEPKQKQKMNIGLEESDDEDLFKTPPIKPQGSKPEEEEEEEEVSMKGCPPPAPLFGDDEEDDDDLDWLG